MSDSPNTQAGDARRDAATQAAADNRVSITRASREADTREKFKRPEVWSPPSVLPDPDPEPGFVFKYIRIEMGGQSDNRNVMTRLREGWEPVRAADYPELKVMADNNKDFADNIVIGGLLLCKNTVELVDQRNAHYSKLKNRQQEAVSAKLMSESDSRMPIHKPEIHSKVEFGRGSS